MSEWASTQQGVIDCHTHMWKVEQEQRMTEIVEAAGIRQMSLLAIQNLKAGSGLPEALYMKRRYPNRFFVFAGLLHDRSGGTLKRSVGVSKKSGKNQAKGAMVPPRFPSLVQQVDQFVALGCDGIKMIEGKPTSRQTLPIAFEDIYYADYFRRVEELQVPMLWHVNDPEEFWDPKRLPKWAAKRKWGYGPGDVQKEQLYGEVEWVLDRHPRLKIIFAHFYFFSADLPRAAQFLDDHPSVCIDLAPGVEMLYNISRDPDAGREFFTRYADRICFGSDIQSSNTVQEGVFRSGITYRWLESTDTFRVPKKADFLLGPPTDGIIRGMGLPESVLRKIYRDNFIRMVGGQPRALDRPAAREWCGMYAELVGATAKIDPSETPAAKVTSTLR